VIRLDESVHTQLLQATRYRDLARTSSSVHVFSFFVSFPVKGALWMENLLAVDVGPITRQFVVRAEGFFGGLFILKVALLSHISLVEIIKL
jgi:hypothetical protein